MRTLHVPPGRTGRLWLRHRLDIAQRGCDVLERKLRILRAELQPLTERARTADDEWRERVRDAEMWLLRADLIGGSDTITHAATADVRVTWTTTMGVRHPEDATCAMSVPPALGGSALLYAQDAYQRAAVAGVRNAAAQAAVSRLAAEVQTTGQRVRALRRRWIPLLREALSHVEFELEELERAEATRRLRASGRSL